MKRTVSLLTVLVGCAVPSVAFASPVPPVPFPTAGQFVSQTAFAKVSDPTPLPAGAPIAGPDGLVSPASSGASPAMSVSPDTDGGGGGFGVGSTAWYGYPYQYPGYDCSHSSCAGTGEMVDSETGASWNAMSVCGAQLVTGGWQLLTCNASPSSGTEYSGTNPSNGQPFYVGYSTGVCDRWYSTFVYASVLWTGGWQYADGAAPGFENCVG